MAAMLDCHYDRCDIDSLILAHTQLVFTGGEREGEESVISCDARCRWYCVLLIRWPAERIGMLSGEHLD